MKSPKPSKLEDAITVIEYQLKKRKRKNQENERRLDLNENQKLFLNDERDLIMNVEVLVANARRTYGEIIGKMPPSAKELEDVVLGAAILETKAFAEIKGFLLPEHFYQESHKLVYESMLRLGHNMHMQSIVMDMRRVGTLDLVGGAHFILELTAKVSTSATIEYNARILIEMAIKRRLILCCATAMSDAYEDSADCFDILEGLEQEIAHIKSWIKPNPNPKPKDGRY